LFEAGKALMQEKRYVEACAKYQASHDLDREAVGTILNLALCHEAINKRASAWVEFREVAARSSAAKREDRVAIAREHEAKLLPLLAYVTIVVEPKARVQGMRVELDGQPVDEAAWGTTDLPIDPGKHIVTSTAPGRPTSVQEVLVSEAPRARQSVVVTAPAEPPVDRGAPEPATAPTGHRTLGLVLGAAGLAATATGVVFGIVATNRYAHAETLCANDLCPDQATRSDAEGSIRTAKEEALVSDVAIGVGLAALLVGGYLVLTSTSAPSPPRSTAVRVLPAASARAAALQLSAAW
jgi:hypothetical protein